MARRSLLRRGRRRTWAPVPPLAPPPGRIVLVEDRGEMLLRDSGGDGQALLLLHGWMATADLNWLAFYDPLIEAGYRVLAVDHRGHGRGLRPDESFTLVDCAADTAALLRTIGAGPVIACGYSMGGPIAELLARDHGDLVSGLVLCATGAAWDTRGMKRTWQGMALLRLYLSLLPRQSWRWGLRMSGFPESQVTSWAAAELSRASGRDVAEAGRELGRYDGRPWLPKLDAPASVLVTTKDRSVPPRYQHELARLLSAPTFPVAADHVGIWARREEFVEQFLAAVRSVEQRAGEPAAAAASDTLAASPRTAA